MDNNIPSYGTNGGVQEQQSGDIFSLFQNFLGHFWASDRTGMGQNLMSGKGQNFFSSLLKGDQ